MLEKNLKYLLVVQTEFKNDFQTYEHPLDFDFRHVRLKETKNLYGPFSQQKKLFELHYFSVSVIGNGPYRYMAKVFTGPRC